MCLCALTLAPGCSSIKRFLYQGFGRDTWQQPERVIAELDIQPGARVADIGAGGGYFTFRLADAVGENGEVYAVDVDDDMLGYLSERAEEEGYAWVRVVKGDFDDPLLPDSGIDLVFTSNTFHHLEDQVAYFRGVQSDLRPGGRIAVLDLNRGGWLIRNHFTPKDDIVRQMTEAGYKLERDLDFIDRQSFLVFSVAP